MNAFVWWNGKGAEMAKIELSYVRQEMAQDLPPPPASTGFVGWARANLFSSITNSAMTIAALAFVAWAGYHLFHFFVLDAVFVAEDGSACKVKPGACWAFIWDRMDFFIYGFFPKDPYWASTDIFFVSAFMEYWRINVLFVVGAALLIPLLIPSVPGKLINALLFFIPFPLLVIFLLNGGWGGLEYVPTEKWGGLTVTLIIGLVGIVASLPIGIVLALGRQSKLPAIKTLCVVFIEIWRAVPLITVLFMASVMLPLFVPENMTIDKLLRALIGVALFNSAYMAEVVRGGLQALPRGQYEAASALGLNYWKSMGFIILPQALKHVIPGIVNTFIALFKDTSLVAIVGIFDLLRTVQNAAGNDLNWGAPTTSVTGYIFAAAMFWIFCFSMSRYSMFMERRLETGHKR